MSIPILGEHANPYIVVEMIPGLATGTFDIKLDTRHFPGGPALAAQCLLQSVVFMLPQAFQSVAETAIQQLLVLKQQQARSNGAEESQQYDR